MITSCLLLAALVGPAGLAAQGANKASGSTSDTPILDELRAKGLLIPVAGVSAGELHDSFRDPRPENRKHYAIDIVAPRGTAVLSADSGRILKLYRGASGGLMVYATDPAERYIYSYAHLDRYHQGLSEGMPLARGDTIGYVGTSGNAPDNYPHLHFAIYRSHNIQRWSRGLPVNPAKVFENN
jgi:murein DD-endopeptidase MepM/ murein hydrolase activator NlpD